MKHDEVKGNLLWAGGFDDYNQVEEIADALANAFVEKRPIQVIIFKKGDKYGGNIVVQKEELQDTASEGDKVLLPQAVSPPYAFLTT